MAFIATQETLYNYFSPAMTPAAPRARLLSLSNNLLLEIGNMMLDEAWEDYRMDKLFRAADAYTCVELTEVYESKEGLAFAVLGPLARCSRRLYRTLASQLWHTVRLQVCERTDCWACPENFAAIHHLSKKYARAAIVSAPQHHLFRSLFSSLPKVTSIALWTRDEGTCDHAAASETGGFALGESMKVLHELYGTKLRSLQLHGVAANFQSLYTRLHPTQLALLPSFSKLNHLTFGCMFNISDRQTFVLAQTAFRSTLEIIARCEQLTELELAVGSFGWHLSTDFAWKPKLTELVITKYVDNGRDSLYLDVTSSAGTEAYRDEVYCYGELESTVTVLLRRNCKTLERLTLKGFGTFAFGATVPDLNKLQQAQFMDASWQSVLAMADEALPEAPLRHLLIHDRHLVFQDEEYEDPSEAEIALDGFSSLTRRTRRLVKQHAQTLKTLAIHLHWPMYSNANAELLQDVKDEFDAMVGGMCRSKGVEWRFEVDP